jgi:outer membrane protein assembly factor BamB
MSNEPPEESPEQPAPAISPRLAGYLCPPAGLWLHWRAPKAGLGEKIFSSIGLLAYTILYIAIGVLLLKAAGRVTMDWPGYGWPPRLAWAAPTPSADDWGKTDQSIDADATGLWSGFRGLNRDGHYTGQPIRTDWAQSPPRQVWKTTVGGSHSSMTIAQGLVFTLEQWKEGEAVTACNAADGQGVWQHVHGGAFNDNYGMGGEGPRSTPTWDDGRLYALGAKGHLSCHDAATGKVIWEKNILEENETRNLQFGLCASPLVAGEKLIITAGAKARGRNTIIAYNKLTGEIIWKTAAGTQAYMSPMNATLAGRPQLLITGARELMGLALEDGSQLWGHRWTVSHDNNIAQPIVIGDDRVFISAGYNKGGALIQVARDGDNFSVKELWKNDRLKNKFTSSVLHEGHIYGLDDQDDKRAVLVCLEAATGDEKWRGADYGHGQLLLAGGHLVILSEAGEIALVKAVAGSFQETARISALSGKTWNNPALAGGRLYIRNGTQMACYDISQGSTGGSAPALFNTSQSVQVIAAGLGMMLLLGGGVLLAVTMSRKSAAVPGDA